MPASGCWVLGLNMCTTRSNSNADYLIYVLCFSIFLKYQLWMILEIHSWENRFIVKPSQSWKWWNRISTNVVGCGFKELHITTYAFMKGAGCTSFKPEHLPTEAFMSFKLPDKHGWLGLVSLGFSGTHCGLDKEALTLGDLSSCSCIIKDNCRIPRLGDL